MATNKAKEAASEAETLINDMSEQALRNWEKAFRSGLKMQEQAGKWWAESWNAVSVAQDWQKRMMQFSSVATSMIPQAQKQMEQAMDLAAKNARVASDIYQKAVDAVQSPVLPERDSKWMDLWTSSMKAVQSNTEAVMEMNNQAFNSWIQFMRRSEMADARAKAA